MRIPPPGLPLPASFRRPHAPTAPTAAARCRTWRATRCTSGCVACWPTRGPHAGVRAPVRAQRAQRALRAGRSRLGSLHACRRACWLRCCWETPAGWRALADAKCLPHQPATALVPACPAAASIRRRLDCGSCTPSTGWVVGGCRPCLTPGSPRGRQEARRLQLLAVSAPASCNWPFLTPPAIPSSPPTPAPAAQLVHGPAKAAAAATAPQPAPQPALAAPAATPAAAAALPAAAARATAASSGTRSGGGHSSPRG